MKIYPAPRKILHLTLIILLLFSGLDCTFGAPPKEVAGALGLWRGGSGEFYAITGEPGGLYRSQDGAAWAQMALQFPPAYFTAVATGPGGVVYATGSGGLLRSPDSGQTWQSINTPETVFFLLALADGSNLLARTWKSGLLRSENNGNSWYPVGAEFGAHPVFSLLQDQAGILWAATFGNGVFRSLDQGVTWEQQGLSQRHVLKLVLHEKNLYAGIYQDGVYHYDANRQIWNPINSGLPESATITVLTSTPLGLVAGITESGIYLKSGDEWHLTESAPSYLEEISGVLVDRNGNWLVATRPAGLFQVNPIAHAWIPVSLHTKVGAIAVNRCGGAQVILESGAWLRSTGKNNRDCGIDGDWEYCGIVDKKIDALVINHRGDLLSGGQDGITLYPNSAKDHCSTAQKKIAVLPRSNLEITCLAVTKSGLIAGTRKQGLIHSNDDGATWNYLSESSTIHDCVAFDQLIYTQTERGISISDDEGISWQRYPLSAPQIVMGSNQKSGVVVELNYRRETEFIESINGLAPTALYLEENTPISAPASALIVANDILYLAANTGIDLLKRDAGVWRWQGQILPHVQINLFRALNDGRVLAGSDRGLFILNGLNAVTQIPLAP